MSSQWGKEEIGSGDVRWSKRRRRRWRRRMGPKEIEFSSGRETPRRLREKTKAFY